MSDLLSSVATLIGALKDIKGNKMIFGIVATLGAIVAGLNLYYQWKDQQREGQLKLRNQKLEEILKLRKARDETVKLMSEYRIELLKVVNEVTLEEVKKVIADLDKILAEDLTGSIE